MLGSTYDRLSEWTSGMAKAALKGGLCESMSGNVLLSHTVPGAVPSALKGLASGFGMGPGVSPSPWLPKLYGDVAVSRPYLGNRTVDAVHE